MKPIIIVGGGPAGVAAALVLAKHHEVTVIDPLGTGGNPGGGGLFYIHQSELFDSTFKVWGIRCEQRAVRSGLYLKGRVYSFKAAADHFGKEPLRQFVLHHYTKTRRTTYGFHDTAMNEGGQAGPQRYMVSVGALGRAVEDRVKVMRKGVVAWYPGANTLDVRRSALSGDNQEHLEYSHLVWTLPLPLTLSMLGIRSPVPLHASDAYMARVEAPSCRDFVDWDFVYTPYTPGNSLYRLSPLPDGAYNAEGVSEQALMLDVNSVFGSDASIVGKPRYIRTAHVFGEVPVFQHPSNVLVLGRFAQWDPRMTMDKALERAERWRAANGL